MPDAEFVRTRTRATEVPLVPEVRLLLFPGGAEELWLDLAEREPPFWAFAWAGGQALARCLLDHPNLVRGKRVLDVASGSGLCAIAALLAGASSAAVVDPDPLAAVAARENAKLNDVTLDVFTARAEDVAIEADVVLCGDAFYDAAMASSIFPWLTAASSHAVVLVGDPGRAYLPTASLERLETYAIPVAEALEGKPRVAAAAYRLRG